MAANRAKAMAEATATKQSGGQVKIDANSVVEATYPSSKDRAMGGGRARVRARERAKGRQVP